MYLLNYGYGEFMDRNVIIRRVLAKIGQKEQMSLEDARDLIFKEFVKEEEIFKPNYKKEINISNEQHDQLRKIYDEAPVKQLYTYSLGRFGFILEGIKFEVEPASVSISKQN